MTPRPVLWTTARGEGEGKGGAKEGINPRPVISWQMSCWTSSPFRPQGWLLSSTSSSILTSVRFAVLSRQGERQLSQLPEVVRGGEFSVFITGKAKKLEEPLVRLL